MARTEATGVSDEEREMLRDLHRALCVPPPGQSRSLLQRAAETVEKVERGEWAVKALIRTVMTVGGIVGAIVALQSWKP
jgi:hypothetical protein